MRRAKRRSQRQNSRRGTPAALNDIGVLTIVGDCPGAAAHRESQAATSACIEEAFCASSALYSGTSCTAHADRASTETISRQVAPIDRKRYFPAFPVNP